LTIDSEIARDSALPQGMTVHGTLAAALTLNSTLLEGFGREYVAWEATWPSPDDVSFSMPMFWARKWQRLLPPHARGLFMALIKSDAHSWLDLLEVQLKKFDADWSLAQDMLTSTRRTVDDFKYYWALVNSRCYYWQYASRRPVGGGQLPADECMALCPFADLFNHANDGVCIPLCSIDINRDSATSRRRLWVAP
jgi:hypothetical protein